MTSLRLALAHLAPTKAATEHNRERLVEAVETAAAAGAKLVIAPEMAVNGYGFADREAAARVAEPLFGPTLAALTEVCERTDVWCIAGFVQRDQDGDALHNAALVVAPTGLAGLHHKLTSPERWVTLGQPTSTIVGTPWGQLGVLICADSYYSGPMRALALRGAQAVALPAAWPQSGVDPRRIWSARAHENGLMVFAANRTGIDGTFDASTGPSAIVNNDGSIALEHVGPKPRLLIADIALENGHFPTNPAALHGREPQHWDALAAGFQDNFPTAVPPLNVRAAATRAALLAAPPLEAPSVAVLAQGQSAPRMPGVTVFGCDAHGPFASHEAGIERSPAGPLTHRVNGTLVGALTPDQARHPEAVLDLARRGCRLIVVPAPALTPPMADLIMLRRVERMAVAMATPSWVAIAEPPADHTLPTPISAPVVVDLTLRRDYSTIGGVNWAPFDRLDLEALCQSTT